MKNNSKTPRFEVDFKERLAQARVSRLPALGFRQYRVYDIVEKKDKDALNNSYGQHVGRGIRTGPLSFHIAGGKYLQYTINQTWLIVDELESKLEPAYNVQWLKPKQATLLRLKGHRVEEV